MADRRPRRERRAPPVGVAGRGSEHQRPQLADLLGPVAGPEHGGGCRCEGRAGRGRPPAGRGGGPARGPALRGAGAGRAARRRARDASGADADPACQGPRGAARRAEDSLRSPSGHLSGRRARRDRAASERQGLRRPREPGGARGANRGRGRIARRPRAKPPQRGGGGAGPGPAGEG